VGRTAVTCRLLPDGRVEVVTGAPEQGTGTYTLIQRLAAQALSVPLECVRVRHADTSAAEPDAGIGGSRATNVYGNATYAGASAFKAKLQALASEVMGWPSGQVALHDGAFRDAGGHAASFLDVTRRIARGAPVESTGTFDAHSDGNVSTENFCGYAAEVEVDATTGQVSLRHVVFVADVGAIINPVAHAGQVQGGFVYGLGSATMEDLELREGQVTTLTLGDYKLPTSADVPRLDIALLAEQPGPGPLGAKAAGELTNTTVAPAIANAVAAAVGARVTELPITSERVLAALERTH
jgi:xanthine dehydrogenase molybdenum-binding subunit